MCKTILIVNSRSEERPKFLEEWAHALIYRQVMATQEAIDKVNDRLQKGLYDRSVFCFLGVRNGLTGSFRKIEFLAEW